MFDKARRMLRIDMEKLRQADSSHLFWMDLTMLIVVLINLLYLFFGFLFQFHAFNTFVRLLSVDFHQWYTDHLFGHVYFYDLIFVAIYVAELLFRWIRSIYRKKYEFWWFYPFVHWYDVIMCIPLLHGYNFFAAVRLFGLFYRLQRLGVFDVTKTYVFKKSTEVSEIFVEEISDRVIAKMITMMQNEVQQGSPVLEKIISDVVKPKEDVIVNYLSGRIGASMNKSYTAYRGELKTYIETIISEAVKENDTVDALRYIPGLGKIFQDMLDKAVADITFNTIDKLMQDVISPHNREGIRVVTHGLIESLLDREHPETQELNAIIVGIVSDSLEEVKRSVLVKEWKMRQLEKDKPLQENIAGDA